MSTLVPNLPPSKPSTRRLALVGEAPGLSEATWHTCNLCGHEFETEWNDKGHRVKIDYCTRCYKKDIRLTPKPFVGRSGKLLSKLLAEVGVAREACFLGNVCQVQPPLNEIKFFKWDGEEIQSGLRQLQVDLAAYQPHFVLCLGNTPLRALRGEKGGVGDWRGSLFVSSFLRHPSKAVAAVAGADLATAAWPPEKGEDPGSVKCMATYHPAALLREPQLTCLVRWDLKRMATELRTDELVLPRREVVIAAPERGFDAKAIVRWCATQRELRTPLSVDIEGVVDYIECVGFGTGPGFAFVVPFIHVDGTSFWSEEDEVLIWRALKGLLEDREVPKILTNALYDAFVLAWSYGIVIRPISDDTMVKWHELYCELEKSLAMQTSVLTREPYYKFERKRAYAIHTESVDSSVVLRSVADGAGDGGGGVCG